MHRTACGSEYAAAAERPAAMITRVSVQPTQPPRVAVFLEGTLAFEVAPELVAAWDLRVGRSLSGEEQARLAAAAHLLAAQALALQYLAARPRTAHEVRQKLRRSRVAEAVVVQVLARLQARGVLDDAAYTHAYLPSRLASRGYGPQRLQRELHQRGVSRALVEEAVEQDLPAEAVLAVARAQAAKRWPRLVRTTDPRQSRQKLWAFLRRRGFSAAVAHQILAELAQGPEGDG